MESGWIHLPLLQNSADFCLSLGFRFAPPAVAWQSPDSHLVDPSGLYPLCLRAIFRADPSDIADKKPGRDGLRAVPSIWPNFLRDHRRSRLLVSDFESRSDQAIHHGFVNRLKDLLKVTPWLL
jgi:hypothetical protein